MAEQLSQQGRSRRHFMTDSAALAKGSLLVLTVPAIMTACREAQQAILSGDEFQILTEEEANEFAAMAARIIPSDETPGATEAGVIYFMDNVLGDESRAEILESLKSGMLEMQTVVALDYNAPYFHGLDAAQQDAVLRQIETTPFFNTIRYLTLAGMFSLPEYGGNRNDIGFQLMGIPGHGAWSPPFGYYDADYMEKGE